MDRRSRTRARPEDGPRVSTAGARACGGLNVSSGVGTAGATVVLMAGLPASGKTTTAARLHAMVGGELIRSCDVYQALGIDLPEWVRRTRGFTVNVTAYDRAR